MQPLFRYGLDLTGTNPDNFINNEIHNLNTKRNRPVVPKAGPFFADTLVLIDNANLRILTRGVDYVPIELNQILSLRTGKDIFGAAIVINREVSSSITIAYNCVGGEYEQSAQTLFDLLDKIPDDGGTFSWYEIDGKPKEWFPTPHFHPIGSPSGFEEICHRLDRIEQALVFTDIPAFKNMLSYIKDAIEEINQNNKYRMDAYFGPQLIAFKKQLTAAFYDLEKVLNFDLATEEDGRIIARFDSITKNFPLAKYIAINSLIAFKNALYNNFVLSETTHIGLTNVFNVSPDAESILSLRTGSIRSIVSKNDAIRNSANINISIYPADTDPNNKYSLMRVSANNDNRGGIFFLIESTGKRFYVVRHRTGSVEDQFTHVRVATETEYKNIEETLTEHIGNNVDAHKVTKSQVNLGFVENLPIITIQEILCLDNARKYITFELFLLFIKTFMIGKNDGDDIDRDGNTNPVEELTIYKPIGEPVTDDPCCCPEPEPCPEPVPTPTPDVP